MVKFLKLKKFNLPGVSVDEGKKELNAERISSILISLYRYAAIIAGRQLFILWIALPSKVTGMSFTCITLIFQVPFKILMYPFSKTVDKPPFLLCCFILALFSSILKRAILQLRLFLISYTRSSSAFKTA